MQQAFYGVTWSILVTSALPCPCLLLRCHPPGATETLRASASRVDPPPRNLPGGLNSVLYLALARRDPAQATALGTQQHSKHPTLLTSTHLVFRPASTHHRARLVAGRGPLTPFPSSTLLPCLLASSLHRPHTGDPPTTTRVWVPLISIPSHRAVVNNLRMHMSTLAI